MSLDEVLTATENAVNIYLVRVPYSLLLLSHFVVHPLGSRQILKRSLTRAGISNAMVLKTILSFRVRRFHFEVVPATRFSSSKYIIVNQHVSLINANYGGYKN